MKVSLTVMVVKQKTFPIMSPDVILHTTSVEITDSDSDSSFGKQAQQWMEMKTYGLPHNTKCLSTA
jgi:hypothetical protein